MVKQRRKKRMASAISQSKRSSSRYSLSPEYSLRALLDFIGLRPIKKNPPLTPQQKSNLITNITIAFVIFILTLASRFYRLEVPNSIVFDEIHFAGFIHHYLKGTYLFDIHPPLGKLTLVAVAKLFGYRPIDYSFGSIGQSFGDLVYYPQRAFSALAGSFIPPVMFLTARSLSLSIPASIATAAMPLFDMLLCVESRLILTDSQLILYLQLSYLTAFLLWQTPRSTANRYALLCLTALASASALTTKWTAFVAPLLIAFVSLTGVLFPYARLDLLEMVAAAVIAGVVYIGSFWLHFKMLPFSGSGDAFMTNEFQATLLGNKQYNPDAPKLPFLRNFWYLNWEMLRANSAITTRHPWESKWYEWLYNARGVLYSDEIAPGGLKERIYIVVNPVLSAITGIGVVVGTIYAISHITRWLKTLWNENDEVMDETFNDKFISDGEKADKLRLSPEAEAANDNVGVLLLLFVSWCANLFPYIGISRCTFLYHVLPALQISCLMSGIMLDKIPRKFGLRLLICTLIIIAMGAAFYHWRPWVYALPRTEKELQALRLLPRWT